VPLDGNPASGRTPTREAHVFRRDEDQKAGREQRKAERQDARAQRRAEALGRVAEAKQNRDDLKLYVKEHRRERIAEFSGIHLFPDRIIRLPSMTTAGSLTNLVADAGSFPVGGVKAVVDQVGEVSARTTLTRTLVPGAHGWQKKVDNRECFLTITGPEFQWVLTVDQGLAGQAGQFAAKVTGAGGAAAQGASEAVAPVDPSAPQLSAADEVRELAELRDAGVVTPEEFDNAKARLLGNL